MLICGLPRYRQIRGKVHVPGQASSAAILLVSWRHSPVSLQRFGGDAGSTVWLSVAVSVAAEAGVSLRLVQYYFGTKEELLLAAMQYLAARFAARAVARFKEASGSGGPANPRDVIAAILAEALPADDERRTFNVVYTAHLALSLTDPALAIAPLVKNSDAVIDVAAAQLRAAQAVGDTPVHLDPALEAFSLMAMSAGLATSVLAGQSSVEQAQAVIDYHLYRLFPASRPALK
jgi:AcrR family transcriptional regulator